MSDAIQSPYLLDLKDTIDITRAPFSDRGSRILVSQDQNQLVLKIARRNPKLNLIWNDDQVIPVDSIRIQFLDENNVPLHFSVQTYPHLLLLNTSSGVIQIGFQDIDTLAIGFPGKCGILLQAGIQRKNSLLEKGKGSRNLFLSCFSKHPIKANYVKKTGCPFEISVLSEKTHENTFYLKIGENPQSEVNPEDISAVKTRAEQKWHDWFGSVPEVSGKYRTQYYYAWWVLANNLVAPGGFLSYEALMPSKMKYIGVWNWDACFHALGLRHQDPVLARNQLRLFTENQLENGMLPDAVFDQGVVDWIDHPIEGDVTKPPLIAWAALKMHSFNPDHNFLEEIYPHVCRWNKWWFSRLDSSGLPQYHHPYSSGLDDSPLWDYPFPITSPDLITYLIVQMQSLAEMAYILGKQEEAASWQDQVPPLINKLVEVLYHPGEGIFLAKSGENYIKESTPFNILPIWTNRISNKMLNKLVSKLQKGGIFWKRYPLQTVSSDSPSYDPNLMWRGPVWVNVNYLFIEALRKVGKSSLSRQLREDTLELMNSNPGFFEYYHPQTGLPPQEAAAMFSWSAAVFIDLVLEKEDKQTIEQKDIR